MASPIEDYALLSDTESCALVARDGSIDWLTFPRFDSPACFAALLGTEEHGRWLIAPMGEVTRVERRYRPGTLVLETTFHTAEGVVTIVDCMPPRDESLDLMRLVRGVSGSVAMKLHLTVRFDYGSIVPWVTQVDGGITIIAGPDALALRTPVKLRGEGFSTVAEFTVGQGDEVPFDFSWYPSHLASPARPDVAAAIDRTTAWWTDWSSRCAAKGPYATDVRDSLVVLKGLTYAPTGGIVAAATTSLPEAIGGGRNWDYRYCWLRDATFSLLALMESGYTEEAVAWREWLIRALAGKPDQAQIMYGPAGEHRLTELELSWLPGYEHSVPVRVGNAAHQQFQLDVYGEVLDALHRARQLEVADPMDIAHGWELESKLAEVAERCWTEPDDGIWEVRGGRRHFTHSKVMAWVALDRVINSAETHGFQAPLSRWRQVRDAIHAEVLAKGVDDRGVFVQSYGSSALDASLLMVPLVGFLPATDARVALTVDAIQQELTDDGFVRRYRVEEANDGVGGEEGAFVMCSFWLADNLALLGRTDEATAMFERLLALRNDVGLLSEQYDPTAKRFLGNIPQAFSHVALVSTAAALTSKSTLRARPH